LTVHERGPVDPLTGPSSPARQALLRSALDLTSRTRFDLQIRSVSALPGVAAYNTADFRLAYRWTEHVELSLVGQNLLDNQQLEQAPQEDTVTAEVPRKFYGQVSWHF
jgi:iron complex outermembrane receptor protein